jgi:L-rhamnonate dehydratase
MLMGVRIDRIEFGVFEGRRPRPAGSNARLGTHGALVRVPLVRLTTDDGASGFGVSRLPREAAARLHCTPLDEVFSQAGGTVPEWREVDLPLWDLAGNRAGRPVHTLLGADHADKSGQAGDPDLVVRCYDTSLYFDDLDARDDAEAGAIMAAEAKEGLDRGHAAFKVKVGRGGRWMPSDEGFRRDVAVVRAVREAVGPDAPVMVDANNGWTLNLTKRFLVETADVGVHWVEESFHEDHVLYEDLHDWIAGEGIGTLVADGECDASPRVLDMARAGVVDVVQYDIVAHTVSGWWETGRRLDGWNCRTAPHGYGTHLGNVVSGHLAAAIDHFTFVEWDEVTTPGLDTSAYRIENGALALPRRPGFAVDLDEAAYARAVETSGWTVG